MAEGIEGSVKKDQEMALRAQACKLEIQQVLAKFDCRTDVYVTIGTSGRVTGNLEINANPLPKAAPAEPPTEAKPEEGKKD